MTRWLPFFLALAVQESKPEPMPTRDVTVADGETVVVKVAVSGASRNFVTAVTLPDAAKGVVSAWDPKDLSVEHDGARLYLKLLSKAEGYVDVTTLSGVHIRLFVQPSADHFDTHVVVKAKATEAHKRELAGLSPLDLVRAMRLGQPLAGVTIAKGGNAALYESAELKATLLWTYDAGRFKGLVLGVANLSIVEPLPIDVTRLAADGLVLVGSRDLSVAPGGSTRLYLVFAQR